MENKQNELSQLVITTLKSNLPIIKQFIKEKGGPLAKGIIQDDAKIKPILHTVYNLLPFPVRMAVNENEFTSFCLDNRKLIFDDAPAKS